LNGGMSIHEIIKLEINNPASAQPFGSATQTSSG
jgi:hypothetical protein